MADGVSKSWHLTRDGERFGPYTSQQLAEMGKEGRITGDMLVWRDGMDAWQPVAKVKGLQVTPVAPVPPPPPLAPAFTVAVAPAPTAAPMPISGHVTIEKTSKSLKTQRLLGLVCIVIGLSMLVIGAEGNDPGSKETNALSMIGSSLFLFGCAWRIITRFRIWWHHG